MEQKAIPTLKLVYGICYCIEKMAHAFGTGFEVEVKRFLDPLCDVGLSMPIVNALQAILQNVPGTTHVIQKRMLGTMTTILGDQGILRPVPIDSQPVNNT